MREEDDDADLVALVAEDYIRRLGRDAASYLRSQGAKADGHGDTSSAQAWRDIADAAEQILRAH